MKIEPLKQELHDEAKALGITKIHLQFSGGSDEGFLYVHFDYKENNAGGHDSVFPLASLEEAIEKWVWSVYEYSGAGDGSEYGDNITYDLEEKKVSHDGWYHALQYEDNGTVPLELSSDDSEA